MATEVDIANKALSHLGNDATVADLGEASVEAMHCARFLPYAIRTLLEMHAWKFAKTRVLGAPVETSFGSWTVCYQEPADCVRVLGVLPEGYTNDTRDTVDFDCEAAEDGSPLVMTNTENATIVYTRLVTDTTKFSPLFVEGLSWLLASYVAGPLIKGQEGAAESNRCFGIALGLAGRGAASNANQHKQPPSSDAPWISGRS